MKELTVLILSSCIGYTVATWSLSNYACNQPQLYQQCNCQNFCSGYYQQPQYYQPQSYGCNGGCGGSSGGYYYPKPRRFRPKKGRKFRIRSSDEDSDEPEVPRRVVTTTMSAISEEEEESKSEGFIAQKGGDSWEDEDLWEQKFVTSKPTRTRTRVESEELPEIDSAEFETGARTIRPSTSSAGQGAGVGSGLGLGNGGLFGISSGVGVGVPGVGPIGVSSGLGIGK